jgi:starch phosphorylase
MWQKLYPGKKEEEVPFGHITNGVHLAGWMKGHVSQFYHSKLGEKWQELINEPETWKQFLDEDFISDEEIWSLRYRLRRELIEFARRRLLAQNGVHRNTFIEFDSLLDPNALTIGFARRFATYKRAVLISLFLPARRIRAMTRARNISRTLSIRANTLSWPGAWSFWRTMMSISRGRWLPDAIFGSITRGVHWRPPVPVARRPASTAA